LERDWDARRKSCARTIIPNEPKIRIVKKTDSFTAIPKTRIPRKAKGCHRFGLFRKAKNINTIKNVNIKKKVSSLPNREKYNIVGLATIRPTDVGVPIGPRLRRHTHGRAATTIPERAGRRRAIPSDCPNNQKNPAVM
jgi:hypothetical protein